MILRCTNKLLGLLGKRTVAASVRKHDLQPLGPFVVGLIEAALRRSTFPPTSSARSFPIPYTSPGQRAAACSAS